jgi:hypothetical protein
MIVRLAGLALRNRVIQRIDYYNFLFFIANKSVSLIMVDKVICYDQLGALVTKETPTIKQNYGCWQLVPFTDMNSSATYNFSFAEPAMYNGIADKIELQTNNEFVCLVPGYYRFNFFVSINSGNAADNYIEIYNSTTNTILARSQLGVNMTCANVFATGLLAQYDAVRIVSVRVGVNLTARPVSINRAICEVSYIG